jgi:hypothetical protein
MANSPIRDIELLDIGSFGKETIVNDSIVNLELGISGVTTLALTNVDVTLTAVQAQHFVQILTGTLTANVNVVVPAESRVSVADNRTTGAFTVTFKTATGGGVAVDQGARTLIYCDGTTVYPVASGTGGGSGSGAPTDATYLVQSPHALLTGAWAVTNTPTVVWDFATPGAAGASIPADAVSYAHIQNVTPTRLLGRFTAGSGDVQEITPGAGLTLDASGVLSATATGQPLDATLTALAGLATGASQLPYFTGTDTAAQTPLTPFARTVLDDADQATMQATLGVVPGTTVQPLDATLSALAGVTTGADILPFFTGTDLASSTPLTAFMRSLLDDADAATARSTLGVTGGGGSSDFLGLTDTPDTYSGQGGKVVAVNAGATALEFITGGGASYTDEQAQDAVGTIFTDSATLDFTYDDATPSLTGSVKDASLTEAKLLLSDVTTHNVSTTQHGLVPKAPNVLTQYLDGTGTWSTPASGGAPTSAEYITSAAHATLSAERVLTDTASVTWDFTTAGQAKATALGGASPVAFRGCLLRVSTPVTAINSTSTYTVIWNSETYDTTDFHSTGTTPTRITIPSGVTRVQLTAGVQLDQVASGGNMSFWIEKNGLGTPGVVAGYGGQVGFVNPSFNVMSAVVDVAAGDYFEVKFIGQDTSVNLTSDSSTFFGCAVVEPYAVGTDTFLTLTDTPDAYTGQGGKVVAVNSGATALEFVTGGGSYTDEQAQDAVGTIFTDSATLDFTYDDTTPSITGSVKDASLTEAKLVLADVTTHNVSTTQHGLVPKAPNVLTQYLDGTGAWSTPPTGTSYTDEQAQDAVGAILVDTATIDFTYNDATPSIVADVKDASLTEVKLLLSDNTTHNVTTTRHGLVPKAPNSATQYLDGTGAWSTPVSGATTFLALTDTPDVYASNALKLLRVNAAANAVEFGDVLGTMATQNSGAVAITGGTATLSTVISNAGFYLNDYAGNNVAGFTSTMNSAGGTNRYAITCQGTAPSYFGGTVQVAGNVTVGNVTDAAFKEFLSFDRNSQHGMSLRGLNSDVAGTAHVLFKNAAGGDVGSITCSATATTYGTASDARLKTDITPLTGALAVIEALNPIAHIWKADGSPGQGFLGHELQQHVPLAVSGEADAINDDGSIRPQQVDHSKLVPILTAGIKELMALVESLAARVTTLESSLGV